jgi:hypothetical protein
LFLPKMRLRSNPTIKIPRKYKVIKCLCEPAKNKQKKKKKKS